MLVIVIEEQELFDDVKQEFLSFPSFTLELEHSLLSLSKWESRFQKPFLGATAKNPHSQEEILGYVEAMILNPIYPTNLWDRLTQGNLTSINNYLESPQTATTFGKMPEHKGRGETITSELIYYWLVAFNVPFEVETWHLNRLFALIRICNIKQGKQKTMSKSELAQRNRSLNAERRAKLNTSG